MSEQKDRKTGRIARFFADRHFGFIVDQTSGDEFFFHEMNVTGEPVKGNQATFEIGSFRGKPTATNLVITKNRLREVSATVETHPVGAELGKIEQNSA